MLWLIPLVIGSGVFFVTVVYPMLSRMPARRPPPEEERGIPDIPVSILEKIRMGKGLTSEEIVVLERQYAKVRGQLGEFMRDSRTKDEVISNLRQEAEQRRAAPAVPPAIGAIRGRKVLSVDGKVLGEALGWTFSEPDGFIGIAIRPNRMITLARVVGFNLRARDISGLVAHPESVASSHVLTVKLDSALKPSDLMTTSEVARLKEEAVDKDRELTARRAETSALNREINRWRNAAMATFMAAPSGDASSGVGYPSSVFQRGYYGGPMSSGSIDSQEASLSGTRQLLAERDRSKVLNDLYGRSDQELKWWRDTVQAQFPEKLRRVFMSDPQIVASTLTEYVRAFRDSYESLPQDAKDILLQMLAGNIQRIQSPSLREQVAGTAEAITGRPVVPPATPTGAEAGSEGGAAIGGGG